MIFMICWEYDFVLLIELKNALECWSDCAKLHVFEVMLRVTMMMMNHDGGGILSSPHNIVRT